ncbi:MAG: alanine racemase [Alistipes sp.]|jgi:alanine racemase|nr:alanine racemase [Alistipes sp.]
MKYLNEKIYGTVLEVSTAAITRNLERCREKLPAGTGIIPIVKASAYGHGAYEIAALLERQGVDYLAVAFTSEGIALRQNGIRVPIIVFNADADSFEELIRHRLEPEIYNFVALNEFVTQAQKQNCDRYPIHIKLDTGMHRLGFGARDLDALSAAIAAADSVKVATIFSHLAAADDPAHDDFTRRQIADFNSLSLSLAAGLPYPVRRHIANTNGTVRFPEARLDMVRLGIGLYGVGMEGVERVASLRTRIISIAELPAGETVGYGRCGVLTRPSHIATIPIGYADGLNRRLSQGAWSVLVNGHPSPIVGNVCMDSCMIDITGIQGVEVGGEAVIFSSAAGNTVEDMAAALGTIPYEVMTSISARVKRIYV